jgi:uncharacterized damage-inducible protein DinB
MKDAIETLRAFPPRLEQAVQGISEADLHRLEAEGKWSVADVIAHLGDLELVYGVRIRTMLGVGGGVALPALAQNQWIENVHRREPVTELLENFALLRKMNVTLLERLDEDELSKTGTHPEYGLMTVRDAAARIVRHDARHFAQIERILSGVR